MRRLASRCAPVLAVLTLALLAPRPVSARVQGTPECPLPVPAPAPNTAYSCHFADMPPYNQSDPNLSFISVTDAMYEAELTYGLYVGTPETYGSPSAQQPYAQSWAPGGPLAGDIGSLPGGTGTNTLCATTAEAMALNAALAYRSSTTEFNAPGSTYATNSPPTYYTHGFNQGQHAQWSWNCAYYANQAAALAALPPGFVGGCTNGVPTLWPRSTQPGAPQPTVFGLQQLVHLSILTNSMPTAGWINPIGSYWWDYYVSMAPFAAEFYNLNVDGDTCWQDSMCSPGYCVNSAGGLIDLPRDFPSGHCVTAASQTLTTWSPVPGSTSTVSITNAGLKAAIDRGGAGILAQWEWQVVISNTSPQQVTFTKPNDHYVALQGYDVYYDASTNEHVAITYINPAGGAQVTEQLVDLANGTYTGRSGVGLPYQRTLTLPAGATNVVAWPVEDGGTGKAVTDVFSLYDGEQVYLANEAYFIYVQ